MANVVIHHSRETVTGLATVASGLPVYCYFRKASHQVNEPEQR